MRNRIAACLWLLIGFLAATAAAVHTGRRDLHHLPHRRRRRIRPF